MIRRLVSRLAIRALYSSFPSCFLPPRGRFARARLVSSCRFADGSSSLLVACGPVWVRGVALGNWCGPVGAWLCGLAFRWV